MAGDSSVGGCIATGGGGVALESSATEQTAKKHHRSVDRWEDMDFFNPNECLRRAFRKSLYGLSCVFTGWGHGTVRMDDC